MLQRAAITLYRIPPSRELKVAEATVRVLHEGPTPRKAMAPLETGIRLPIHEGMEKQDVLAMATAVRKVADHYAA